MIGDKDPQLDPAQVPVGGGYQAEAAAPPDPWEHRSLNMRCRTCMHYVPKKGPGLGPETGRCRRHAPTMNGFPVVFATEDWCGDHKLA